MEDSQSGASCHPLKSEENGTQDTQYGLTDNIIRNARLFLAYNDGKLDL